MSELKTIPNKLLEQVIDFLNEIRPLVGGIPPNNKREIYRDIKGDKFILRISLNCTNYPYVNYIITCRVNNSENFRKYISELMENGNPIYMEEEKDSHLFRIYILPRKEEFLDDRLYAAYFLKYFKDVAEYFGYDFDIGYTLRKYFNGE